MDIDQQDSFEQLQKLLALKRHEQPPPRFFEEFSSKVIARIQALEHARPITWRQRLGLDFDFRPAMMGALGVVVCGLLLIGVITSLGVSQSSTPTLTLGSSDPSAFFASSPAPPELAGGMSLNPIISPDEVPASTDPVSAPSSGSPFNQFTPRAERATFLFRSGN